MTADDRSSTRPFKLKVGKNGRTSVRLDRPAGTESEASPSPDFHQGTSPESGGLFDLIRRRIRARRVKQERRESVRHPAIDPGVWVGWWDGDDFGVVEGRMTDLSRGGAQIWMDVRPPSREPIWFYKETGDVLATVRGYVVRSGVSREGGYAVRFRFATICPTFFCQAALCEQPLRESSGLAKIVPPH